MKIDPNRIDLTQPDKVRTDAVRDERPAGVERPTAASRADHVHVSGTSQLAAAAAAAALEASDIRPDAVARGKALLASGDLGKDPARLADALLDAVIDPS